MNKFKETYSFEYLLFQDSFFGIVIQILIKIECKIVIIYYKESILEMKDIIYIIEKLKLVQEK